MAVWGLWHTCPDTRGSWHTHPMRDPRSGPGNGSLLDREQARGRIDTEAETPSREEGAPRAAPAPPHPPAPAHRRTPTQVLLWLAATESGEHFYVCFRVCNSNRTSP